jgi:hypothetical protein
MDNKMIFDIFKAVIIEQNKMMLKDVAKQFDLDYETLVEKYIKPEYYLPVIVNTTTTKK